MRDLKGDSPPRYTVGASAAMSLLDLFRGPALDDPHAERSAAVLAPLLTILALVLGVTALAGLTLAWGLVSQFIASFVFTGVLVWARVQVHRGRVDVAAAVTTGMLLTMSVSSLLADATSSMFPVAFSAAIVVGGITMRRPGPLWLGGLSSAAVVATSLGQHYGGLSLRRPPDEPAVAVILSGGFLALAAAIHWANRALARARERAVVQEERAHALQQTLFRGQRMEAVGRLAGGIAHDFNNLLTVVMANAMFLDGSSEGSEDAIEARDAIIKATEGGANLTRQLLAFGGRQVVRPELVDVAAVVQDFRSVFEHMGDKSRTLTFELPIGLGCARMDPGQLQQAVGNLIVNAANASEPGATIRVALESVELSEDRLLSHGTARAGTYRVLRVVDTGAGMTPSELAAAFEPFFTTRRQQGGSGLGLAVVHGAVTQGGGQVEIQSIVGQGTTVSLWLPHADGAPTWSPAPARGSIRDALSGLTILLVDDTDAARGPVRQQLEQAGATVLEATNGEEALALVDQTSTISAAIVDVLMPGMSGAELVTRLRKVGFTAPVTFLTGYAEPEGLLSSAAASIPILYKPASTADLVKAIRAQASQAAG